MPSAGQNHSRGSRLGPQVIQRVPRVRVGPSPCSSVQRFGSSGSPQREERRVEAHHSQQGQSHEAGSTILRSFQYRNE